MLILETIGGWKPNMWNNFPKFEMEKIKQLPIFTKEPRIIEHDKVAESKKIYHKDPISHFLKKSNEPL